MALWLKCWASHGLSKFFLGAMDSKGREYTGSCFNLPKVWAYQNTSALFLQLIGFCFEAMMMAELFMESFAENVSLLQPWTPNELLVN